MIRFISTPCPVCGSQTKSCCATNDGLHICRGIPNEGWRRLKSCDNGFSVYRKESFCKENTPKFLTESKNKKPYINWNFLAEKYKKNLKNSHRDFLSQKIGVPDCFDLFDIGIKDHDKKMVFTIPERDESGITGISLRYEGEEVIKIGIKGSKRGLCFPKQFPNDGIIYVVEGFTDCAAMTAAGINCIGRPTNVGGSEYIAKICKNREVIVLGENDWRLCKTCHGRGCKDCHKTGAIFPGLDGATVVSRKMSKILGRKIDFQMPPKGYKDVREFLISLNCPWEERGKQLINSLV
jgi:hypothetical protein